MMERATLNEVSSVLLSSDEAATVVEALRFFAENARIVCDKTSQHAPADLEVRRERARNLAGIIERRAAPDPLVRAPPAPQAVDAQKKKAPRVKRSTPT